MQNGVSSDVYEGKREAKKSKEGRGERRGKKEGGGEKSRKKKMRRDSPNLGGSALSHFEGEFPKVLRKWILGFGGRNKGRQRGSSRESYRYECCVLLFALVFAFDVCSLVFGHYALVGSILTHSELEL